MALEAEHLLVLRGPEGQVLDGARVEGVVRGVDAAGAWRYPLEGTPGEPNVFAERPSVVLSEVMYHAPPIDLADGSIAQDETEWMELLNTGAAAVDLEGFNEVRVAHGQHLDGQQGSVHGTVHGHRGYRDSLGHLDGGQ